MSPDRGRTEEGRLRDVPGPEGVSAPETVFRLATRADAAALLRIYGCYIATPITFEYELPSLPAFVERMDAIIGVYPYLVCEQAGRIVGYAYAHRQMERAAYQWNAELSVYLDPDAVSQGLGRRLYAALMELLRLQGVRLAYALVTVPNPASEHLHGASGFQRVGMLRATGYKDGAWHDVCWFEKELLPPVDAPSVPVPLDALDPAVVAEILRRA